LLIVIPSQGTSTLDGSIDRTIEACDPICARRLDA
jgi:hypothetical protein